ncbi:RHS repeat-associated core domain-containing protein [Geobacter argillaceus]|nr:RHS repeat-associated core domain-containing protein [Geobacter argillaceus]
MVAYVNQVFQWQCNPTCDDGIQNQGETGVDCGGPCSPCETSGDQNHGGGGANNPSPAPNTGPDPNPGPPSPPCDSIPKAPLSSKADVGSGSYSHDQVLFATSGTFSTTFSLYYNSLNRNISPLGRGWSHGFGAKLIGPSPSDANHIYLRSGNGVITVFTLTNGQFLPPAGDSSTLTRNPDNTAVLTNRDGLTYNFDTSGSLTQIVDRHNNRTILTYTNGDLTQITDALGRSITLGYDLTATPHRLTTVTDPAGKSYDIQYQNGRLWRVLNPLADAASMVRGYWEYIYNAKELMVTKRDPNGNTSSNAYYDDLRVQSSIDPDGAITPAGHTRSLVFSSLTGTLLTTTLTEKDGTLWTYSYDTQTGLLKSKSRPDGKATSFTYYADKRLKSMTVPYDGAKLLTTFYTYDGNGNMLTETNPVDLSVYTPAIDPETVTDPATLASLTPPIKPAYRYTYDTAHYDRLTSVSDERGTTPLLTTYGYTTENGGDVVTTTAPGNLVTVAKYNPNGTIRQFIDANQKPTSYLYYPDTTVNRTAGIVGLLQTATGPDGVSVSVTGYDKNGNPLEIKTIGTDGKELRTVRAYDALNRLRTVTRYAANLPDNVTTLNYDNSGNRTLVIDPEQHETKHEYNYNHQVTKITTGTGVNKADTVLTYGATACPSCGSGVDKLTAVTDAKQQTTGFSYDNLGRLQYETDPLQKNIHYTYYDSGLVKEKYDATATPEKLLVTYYYDNLGRLTRKLYADGSDATYSYNPDGTLHTAANQHISYLYDYYDSGRLKSVSDSNGRTISYDRYDGLGQRQQVTYFPTTADQRVISYTYDTANRLQSITSAAGLFTFGYDSLSRRNSFSYPNQITGSYGYDDLNRLTSLTHQSQAATIAAYGYSHDQAGNRRTKTGTFNESYNYEETYRLMQATTARGTEKYTYDLVGNRLTGPGPKDTGYQYDAANRMTKGRQLGYDYDNLGNQTTRTIPNAADKNWTLTWNFENQLTKMEKSKGTTEKRTVTFKYDPLGRRIEKQLTTLIAGVTKTTTYNYVYDQNNIALEIQTDSNNVVTKTFNTHGPGVDEHLAMERNGSFYYFHQDGIKSVTAITDSNRNVVQSYEYESFGRPTPSANFRNSLTYTGREWDKETGLYYLRYRYYDPMDGRFISRDPIGFRGGINLYSYVQNNPINFIDPLGLAPSHGTLQNIQTQASVFAAGAFFTPPPLDAVGIAVFGGIAAGAAIADQHYYPEDPVVTAVGELAKALMRADPPASLLTNALIDSILSPIKDAKKQCK